jgi:hypothetical protein
MQLKKCNICKNTYPKTKDYFYTSTNGKYTHINNPCKKCCAEKSKIQFKKKYGVWVKGVTKHSPDELRRRRWRSFKNKVNKNISYEDYKPIDVLKNYIRENKIKLNALAKIVNKYKPRKKLTFEEKRNNIFEKYNVCKIKRKDYLHYKKIESLTFKVRYDYDTDFNLKQKLRRQLKKKLEKYPHIGDFIRADIKKNNNKPYNLLGYTMKDLKTHLEKYFSGGMTWEKFHRGEIHIDHIIPKCNFNLKDETDIKACWSLENLQPLWAEDNLKKRNKIVYSKQALEINPILAISYHLQKS